MAEVRWTPQAADDLEAITDFIAADSPHYAGGRIESISNRRQTGLSLRSSFPLCITPVSTIPSTVLLATRSLKEGGSRTRSISMTTAGLCFRAEETCINTVAGLPMPSTTWLDGCGSSTSHVLEDQSGTFGHLGRRHLAVCNVTNADGHAKPAQMV